MGRKKFKVGDFVEVTWSGRRVRGRVVRIGPAGVEVGPAEAQELFGQSTSIYWGNAFGDDLKRVKNLGPSNDDIPEDEMTLAELLQNAGRFGLASTRGARFRDSAGAGLYSPGMPAAAGTLVEPPEGAVKCCALGAQSLMPAPTTPILHFNGNDVGEGIEMPAGQSDEWNRSWNIGAAFEQALRPEPV